MKLEDLQFNIIKTEKEIKKSIEKISKDLNERFKNKEEIIIIIVLKGGLYFALDLTKKLTTNLSIDFISSNSYYLNSKINEPVISYSPTICIKDKDVLVIDDFIDSGETINKITNVLEVYKPRSISIAAVIGKPTRKKTKFAEYFCWEEEPEGFLLGYGLDYDEKFRNIPFIGIINKDNDKNGKN